MQSHGNLRRCRAPCAPGFPRQGLRRPCIAQSHLTSDSSASKPGVLADCVQQCTMYTARGNCTIAPAPLAREAPLPCRITRAARAAEDEEAAVRFSESVSRPGRGSDDTHTHTHTKKKNAFPATAAQGKWRTLCRRLADARLTVVGSGPGETAAAGHARMQCHCMRIRMKMQWQCVLRRVYCRQAR
jgi:hypothetical protein